MNRIKNICKYCYAIISIFILHLIVGWKKSWIYSARTMLNVLGSLVVLVLQIVLWRSLTKTGNIENYNQHDIIMYFTVVYFINVFLSPDCDLWLSRQIIRGDISLDLLKPVRILAYIPFESFSLSVYRLLVSGFPVVIITGLIFKLNIHIKSVIMILPLLLLSFIFWVLFELFLGCLTFNTKAYWGVASLKSALLMLLTGKLLPLEFYPDWLYRIIDLNPFAIAYFHIARYMITPDSSDMIIKAMFYQSIYIIVMLTLLIMLWNSNLKKLSVQGG